MAYQKSMLDLLSIHIPKTAGTSFYHVLSQVYGTTLSVSYKRKHLKPLLLDGQLSLQSIAQDIRVIHGHFYYQEVKQLHQATNAKVICWLRDPVDRLISNYDFFIAGLQNPSRNPVNYEHNKHRLNEDLLTYASKEENRNRMHDFLAGIDLESLFFIGRQEKFTEDIKRLGLLLGWPMIEVPQLNKKIRSDASMKQYDTSIRHELASLNQLDVMLYQKALALIPSV